MGHRVQGLEGKVSQGILEIEGYCAQAKGSGYEEEE